MGDTSASQSRVEDYVCEGVPEWEFCLKTGIRILPMSPQVTQWLVSEMEIVCEQSDSLVDEWNGSTLDQGKSDLELQIEVIHCLSLMDLGNLSRDTEPCCACAECFYLAPLSLGLCSNGMETPLVDMIDDHALEVVLGDDWGFMGGLSIKLVIWWDGCLRWSCVLRLPRLASWVRFSQDRLVLCVGGMSHILWTWLVAVDEAWLVCV